MYHQLYIKHEFGDIGVYLGVGPIFCPHYQVIGRLWEYNHIALTFNYWP